MYSLNIENDIIEFRDIRREHLPVILDWYNRVDDSKYATGIDQPLTLGTLSQKYTEAAICSKEFFIGISIRRQRKFIGVLKGRVQYRGSGSLWISSITIDPEYRNMGYGSQAVQLLLSNLKVSSDLKEVYLAVFEENLKGRRFWKKQEFSELHRIDNHITLENRQQNVILMHRTI